MSANVDMGEDDRKWTKAFQMERMEGSCGDWANRVVEEIHDISQYWYSSMVLGNADFGHVMGRQCFNEIWEDLLLYPLYGHDTAVENFL